MIIRFHEMFFLYRYVNHVLIVVIHEALAYLKSLRKKYLKEIEAKIRPGKNGKNRAIRQ